MVSSNKEEEAELPPLMKIQAKVHILRHIRNLWEVESKIAAGILSLINIKGDIYAIFSAAGSLHLQKKYYFCNKKNYIWQTQERAAATPP